MIEWVAEGDVVCYQFRWYLSFCRETLHHKIMLKSQTYSLDCCTDQFKLGSTGSSGNWIMNLVKWFTNVLDQFNHGSIGQMVKEWRGTNDDPSEMICYLWPQIKSGIKSYNDRKLNANSWVQNEICWWSQKSTTTFSTNKHHHSIQFWKWIKSMWYHEVHWIF